MPSSLAGTPRLAGDSTFSFSIRRSTAAGIVFSLVLHVIAVLLVWPHLRPMDESAEDGRAGARPLTARLQGPTAPAQTPIPTPEPAQQSASPPPPAPRPRRSTPARPAPPVITRRAPGPLPPRATYPAPSSPLPPPLPQPPTDNASQTDMMASLNARRADREIRERSDATESGSNREPTAAEVADARIRSNLQQRKPGGSGIFSITDKGIRTATLHFRGWTTSVRDARNEVIEVDAGMGGNVELAIVRKVIERIRRDYDGNFQWESYRLRRVVTLSARREDSAQLEAFLRQELFN